MPLKQQKSLADASEKRDVDVITVQNEQVVISRRSFTADGLATFLTKKQLHLYEDRNDIIERFKGQTISVTQYRSSDPDALIASIQQRNCEYVILEVPHDTSLALFEKIMSFLHQIRTDNTGYNTGITYGDRVITCTCILTEGVTQC